MLASRPKLGLLSLLAALSLSAPLPAKDKAQPKEQPTKKADKTRTPPPPVKPPPVTKKPPGKDTPPTPPPPKPPPLPPKPPRPEPQKPGTSEPSGGGSSKEPSGASSSKEPNQPAAAASSDSVNGRELSAIARELLETRTYRRDASREETWRRWGTATREESVRQELRLHGRRAARLRQALRLAKVLAKAASVERADLLLTLEDRRHERAMLKLTAAAAASPATAHSAAATPAGPKP